MKPSPYHSVSLSEFSEDVFGHLPRQDQRRWAETYLRGLLDTPGKKSVRRMAAAIAAGPTAAQSLHQFVSASPWLWDPARRTLGRWTEQRATVRAWSVVPVVAPKRGEHSVGVHRHFDAAAGRVVNCQVWAGLVLCTDRGDVPVDWRLFLPERWRDDPQRRERARIPAWGDSRPPWLLGLDLTDAWTAHTGAPPVPVVADVRGFGDAAALVNGLSVRCHRFVVGVPESLMVCPGPSPGPRRPERAALAAGLLCAGDHALQRSVPGAPAGRPAEPGPSGPSGPRAGRAAGTGPSGGQEDRSPAGGLWTLSGPAHLPGSHHTVRLLAQWGPRQARPDHIWLTNLVHAELADLVALVGAQTGADRTVRVLRSRFGLLDFEGRSFPGWHHHMTLVSAAYGWYRLSAPAYPRRTRRTARPARPPTLRGRAVTPDRPGGPAGLTAGPVTGIATAPAGK